MMFNSGTNLGRYEIRSQLGARGMGEVYPAKDTKLRRRVAIKFLPSDSIANEQAIYPDISWLGYNMRYNVQTAEKWCSRLKWR
jgi:serine/threonine protein kinase